MSERMKFSEDVVVASQPGEAEFKNLRDEGFRSVVNFRTDEEPDQALSPEAEAKLAERCGLAYCHDAVATKSLTSEQVDRFRSKFSSLPTPVFAHCKSGKRAGAMVMMHSAVERGMSGREALEQAEQMGFECDNQNLIEFVKNYIDEHSKAS